MDLSGLVGLFVGFHVIASERFDVPELSMTMEEGTQLQVSVEKVLRHYSIETTQKTIDWTIFFGTIGTLYGTRFGSYMIRKREERMPQTLRPTPVQRPNTNGDARPKPQQSPTVHPFAGDALIEADHDDG